MKLPTLILAGVLLSSTVAAEVSSGWSSPHVKRQFIPSVTDNHPVLEFARTGKLVQNGRTGVSAMHAVLLNDRKIMVIDKAQWNEARFDSGQYAWSTEYDYIDNNYRALHMDTNSFCSGGGFLGNGTLVSTGGGERRGRNYKALEGWHSIRMFKPCTNQTCEWSEFSTHQMGVNRWYPTAEQLPDGGLFIIGGSKKGAAVNREEINTPSYEFWPTRGPPVHMQFLVDTMPYNLYPFAYLLPSGHLWIFASRSSIIFDYEKNEIVRRLPDIPGNVRSYPLTGTAVMLPLMPENNYEVEVLVCGGAEGMRRKSRADDTCGRINLSKEDTKWEMDTFVFPRLMPDGVLLADGKILFVNGCQRGFAGYNGRNNDPQFTPVIYDPVKPLGQRWITGLVSSTIARMYHSVALLIPDGTVWIAGSGCIDPPNVTATPYPTEFRVEYFSPPYLFSTPRPLISNVPTSLYPAQRFTININLQSDSTPDVKVALINPGFSTHSLHMSQRYVGLESSLSEDGLNLEVVAPPNNNIFPPGPAWFYVTNNGVPAQGVQVMVKTLT